MGIHYEYHVDHHRDFHVSRQTKAFVEGGIASVVAGVATHPLDLIKVRMQLLGEGANAAATLAPKAAAAAGSALATAPLSFAASSAGALAAAPARQTATQVAMQIIRGQGVAGLFSGISATVLRQTLYSSTRLGVYDMLKHSMEAQPHPAPGGLPIHKKIGAGLLSGAIGAAVGNPADLAMVRMQADGRLPVEMRRNYKSVVDALLRISREEGVAALWRGCGPTIYRAMAVTAGQLATYDQAKEIILQKKLLSDGLPAHVAAAFTAAIFASLASNPCDVIKTRLMNMKPDPVTGVPPYSGALDCAVKAVQAEGPLALYKGLMPTIARQGPFALILFVTLEQVRTLMKDF